MTNTINTSTLNKICGCNWIHNDTAVNSTMYFLNSWFAILYRQIDYVSHIAVVTKIRRHSTINTWLCFTRKVITTLFRYSAFGVLALAAAVLNLLRPSLVLTAVALAAAGFGIVLYNVGLAGIAVALLILSLARRAPAPE